MTRRVVACACSCVFSVLLAVVPRLPNAQAKAPPPKKSAGLEAAVKGFQTKGAKKASPTYTLAQVKTLAARADVKKQTVSILSVIHFVLETEAPAELAAFVAKVQNRLVLRDGEKVNSTPEIGVAAAELKARYGLPCSGKLQRAGATWPPAYECRSTEPVAKPTGPTPLVALLAAPRSVTLNGDADAKKELAREDNQLRDQRLALLKQRDGFAVPGENLHAAPRSFCVGKKCFEAYAQVATALYGSAPGIENLPVFCVPQKVGGKWEGDRVHCTGSWLETLNWAPWKANGEPSDPPKEQVIPPYSCVGNPHFFQKHVLLPSGSVAGKSGFQCRNRVFRVLATKAEKSQADVNANIANMCLEMRQQVWGEKYKDINAEYSRWCMSAKGPKDKTICPKAKPAAKGGSNELPLLPFMMLSREELIYFYGHKELFCRADRAGLTHFLYNDKWASTFTCGIDRGLIEAGPFEEGVQLCALSPYTGEKAPVGFITDPFKARLHCWQFSRPTCEQVMLDGKQKDEQKKLDSIHHSSVFDVFDVLKEYRRTRLRKMFSLFDLKDAEKLPGFSDLYSYSDNANDEGLYGVKEFCRFAGNTKTIQCGYDRAQIEHWYQLRQMETPVGCLTGVCARGAFERGYLCGVFSSKELFDGQPYWMCGLDIGLNGRAMLKDAKAICLGGKPFQNFLSPKGETGTLACYERRFRWAESGQSREMLERFDWKKMLEAAVEPVLTDALADKARFAELVPAAVAQVRAKDAPELLAWASAHGHTLGHRTSMRIALTRAVKVSAMQELLKLQLTGNDVVKVDSDVKPDKVKQAKDVKGKELADLIADLRRGERAADGKWLGEWLRDAVEGGVPRIASERVVLGIRVSLLFQILDGARKILQKYASDYTDEVLAKAKTMPPLSRLEVHERAREETLEREGLRGNVYCIPDSAPSIDGARAPSKRYYACATSPLLAMGMVEKLAVARDREFEPTGDGADENKQLLEEFREKMRSQVKSEWCYGSTKDKHVFGGINALAPLFAGDLSSPYQFELPTNALDRNNREHGVMFHPNEPAIWTSSIHWLKCSGFQYNDENWKRAVANKGKNAPGPATPGGSGGGGGGGDGGGGVLMGMVGGMVTNIVNASLGPVADFKKMIEDMSHPAGEFLQGWAQQFIDGATKQWAGSKEKLDSAHKGGDETKQKAKERSEEAQTALDDVITKAEEELEKVKTDSQEALDKVRADQQGQLDKVREEAKAEYDKLREKTQGDVDAVRAEQQRVVDDAKDVAHKAEVAAASAQPAAKADANAAWKEAKDALKEAQQALTEKIRGGLTAQKNALKELVSKNREALKGQETQLKEAVKEQEAKFKDALKEQEQKNKEALKAGKAALEAAKKGFETTTAEAKKLIDELKKAQGKLNSIIANSGQILDRMIDTLVKMITDRVVAAVSPVARDLFTKAFTWVRSALGAVSKGLIAAAGSVPFVGGALAVLVAAAFDAALGAVEEKAIDSLLGVVERVIAKIVRSGIALVQKPLQQEVLKLVHSACAKIVDRDGFPMCPAQAEQVKFAELPPEKRWLERALACARGPVLEPMLAQVRRDAVAARFALGRQLDDLRSNVPMIARNFADEYLRKLGSSYEQVMAAAVASPGGAPVAGLARVRQGLERMADLVKRRASRGTVGP